MDRPSRFLRHCITTCLLMLGLHAGAHAQEKRALTLMVVPQFPATVIHATWGKVIGELDGFQIEMIFAKDIDEFEGKFLRGETDLVYCNPYHMVMAKKAQGYIPLLRDTKPLTGILITPASGQPGHINSLEELKGKTLLFPSPNAFGASLYMRALLSKDHGLKFTTRYVKTHPNVIRGVVRGEGSAGGMVAATYLAESDELRDRVNILYETPPASPHPIAVHPRVPAELRKQLQAQLLQRLKADPVAADGIQMSEPTTADYKRDYQRLEGLGLEEYLSR